MSEYTILSRPNCPFCVEAKRLLKKHGKGFKEIDIADPENKPIARFIVQLGMTTVPQIWHRPKHVGGCAELLEYLEVA